MPLANTIHHLSFLYNQFKKLNLCKFYSNRVINHLMSILISIFISGYHGKTTDFAKNSSCHRTTIAHFLNSGKWDDSLLSDALKQDVIGIIYSEAASLRQIFDPFFTTKKGGEGTGLGLALAEQIVTSHKGYIFAESQLGKGTAFYIGIPVIDAEQAEDAVTVSEKRETRMIFVDDNVKVLELLRGSFEKLGIKITTCITIDEVSERLKNEDADVLVVKENIGGKSGIDFCMSIAGKYPDMIRLISTDSISKEILEAKRKGIIHGFVEKPMFDRSVLEAIRECRKTEDS